MKALHFFSKVAFICNICFALFAVMAVLEPTRPAENIPDIVRWFSFIKDIIITLGFLAIIINLIVCMVYLILLFMKRKSIIPTKLALANFLFLVVQVLYFFVFN